mgnify:CR=1 FL=1
MSLQDSWATFLQRSEHERGLLLQLLQKIFEHVDALGSRITQHSEDHERFIEAVLERLKIDGLVKRKEEPVSAKMTILQLNQAHEVLGKRLGELVKRLDLLGISLTDQPLTIYERGQELLGDPLPPDAVEADLEAMEMSMFPLSRR